MKVEKETEKAKASIGTPLLVWSCSTFFRKLSASSSVYPFCLPFYSKSVNLKTSWVDKKCLLFAGYTVIATVVFPQESCPLLLLSEKSTYKQAMVYPIPDSSNCIINAATSVFLHSCCVWESSYTKIVLLCEW